MTVKQTGTKGRPQPLPHNIAFGVVLARLRRDRKWSQEFLGFESDLTRCFVSLLERGQRSPTLDTQVALCRALGIRLDELAEMVVFELERQPDDTTHP